MIGENLYFLYGLKIGVDVKIIIGFKNDKPEKTDEVKEICLRIYHQYIDDQLNPFNNEVIPSENFVS